MIFAPLVGGAFGNFAAKRSKTYANVINRRRRCHARFQCDRHDHDGARRNVLKIKKKLAKRKSKLRLTQAALSHVARGGGHANGGINMPKLIELNMVVGRSVDDLENASEQTTKVWLNPEEIREFYARREGATGTRISYKNSAGIAVHETPDQVANAIYGLAN